MPKAEAGPPSSMAARSAKTSNATRGDDLRRHLAQLVLYFRKRMRGEGVQVSASMFPVQAVNMDAYIDPVSLSRMLHTAGVRTLLTKQRLGSKPRLLFILNATHKIEDLDCVAEAIEAAFSSPFALGDLGLQRRSRQAPLTI